MKLFKRYQACHCETTLRAYNVVGKALTSEYAYALGHCLKDQDVQGAIRTFQASVRPFGINKKDRDHNLVCFTEYVQSWAEKWAEYSLEYQALNADTEVEKEEESKVDPWVSYVNKMQEEARC